MDREELSLDSAIPFAGRYILKKLLGSGGMGAVYLASDSMLGDDEVALKVLHSQLCQNEKHTKRFLREVQLTRKVTHPNVVRTFDAGRENGRLYFTMEYAQGVTLKDKLVEGPLDLEQVASIIREISKGLYAIHQADIIHRDLKPGNVLLTPEGFIKITDFGVAKPGVSDLTGHNEVIGSIPYMAPEVWVGRNVGPQADIYALGVLAYEMVTGVLPFDGDSPAEMMCKHLESVPLAPIEMRADIPLWLNDLILRMLQKEQNNRPLGAEAVVRAINEMPDSLQIAPAEPEVVAPIAYVQEEILEISGDSFGETAPAALAAPDKSIIERVWSGHTAPGKRRYLAVPQVEQPELSEFAGLSKVQSILRHCGTFLICVSLCALLMWRFTEVTAPWLKVTWEASQQFPILGKILTNVATSFVFFAFIFAMPVFLIASMRRNLKASLQVWLRAAAFMLFALVLNFVFHFTRMQWEASKLQIPFTPMRIFSSAQATIINTAEMAFLAPHGTAYQPALNGKILDLAENPSPPMVQMLPYWFFLGLYLVFLMRTLESEILMRRTKSRKFRGACFLMFGAVPLVTEVILLSLMTMARELFAIRDIPVNVGVVKQAFDRYSVTCAAVNWMFLSAAVVFIIPFCLAQLRKRAQ